MSLLTTARHTVHVFTTSATMAVAGACLGAAASILNWKPPTKAHPQTEESKRKAKVAGLVNQVRVMETARRVLPAVIAFSENREYQLRRELEGMGYYPCSMCGVPHLEGGKDSKCLPEGSYLHPELDKWVDPDHPDWTTEGYKAYWGHEFVPSAPTDDETVH